MNQRWTLHVENFARIESADIEISPLMCFIGDNNSGKSYIMTLLWGIIANGHMFYYDQNKSFVDSPEYAACQKWLFSNVGKKVEISADVAQKYIDWFNKILDANKTRLKRSIFNSEIPIDKIEVRRFSVVKNIAVTVNDKTLFKSYGYKPISSTAFEIDIYQDNPEALFSSNLTDESKLSLIRFLQNEIMHGTIQVKEDNKIIRYTPKDSDTELPMRRL